MSWSYVFIFLQLSIFFLFRTALLLVVLNKPLNLHRKYGIKDNDKKGLTSSNR